MTIVETYGWTIGEIRVAHVPMDWGADRWLRGRRKLSRRARKHAIRQMTESDRASLHDQGVPMSRRSVKKQAVSFAVSDAAAVMDAFPDYYE